MRRAPLACLLALGALACGRENPASPGGAAHPPQAGAASPADVAGAAGAAGTPGAAGDLVDEAAERGLAYVNRSGEPTKPTILEANGAGVALLDLGRDGDLDVVFSQGLGSWKDLLRGPGADVEVFENDGAGRFARGPAPGLAGWWTGLAVGDVDGDGDDDLAVGGFGDLALLVQDERGRLVRASAPGLMPQDDSSRLAVGAPRAAGRPPLWATSLAFLDADRDGRLDLYVGQYVDLDPVAPPLESLGEGELAVPCRWKGLAVFCGPSGMRAQPDRVLRGRGDGSFEDASARWLPGHVAGYTLGVLAFDAEGDGDSDLFVANDSTPNLLLVNDGGLDGACSFADHGYAAGVALSADGRAQAGMGVAAGDVDRDGTLDLAVTNFSDEPTELWFGAPVGFARMTHRMGLLRETRALLSWGVHLADFDGDGSLELATANGHVYPQADEPGTGTRYGQAATLWRIRGGALERVEPASERSILHARVGARGSAVGDLDGDGAIELVLARIDAPAALGINRTGVGNRRLLVRLVGDPSLGGPRRSPADANGARVVVVAGEGAAEHGLLGEVRTAAGYQSASSAPLAFGLGTADRYRAIRVAWPSGRVEVLPAGEAGRKLTVREGQGLVAEERLR